MIQDFFVEQDNFGQFDLVIDEERKDFKSVSGFETALSVQLFTDKRGDRFDTTNILARQGWIGDLLTIEEGYRIGSYIWTKRQSRNTQIDRNEVAQFAKNSFDNLIAQGAIKEIIINIIDNNIELTSNVPGDGVSRYNKLWRNTNVDID